MVLSKKAQYLSQIFLPTDRKNCKEKLRYDLTIGDEEELTIYRSSLGTPLLPANFRSETMGSSQDRGNSRQFILAAKEFLC